MPGWTLVETHPTQGRTFQRPLDNYELSFLWESLFNGTTDSILHYELRLKNGPLDAHFFSEANIVKAWLSTKRRFPLVGATVGGMDSDPLTVATDSNANNGAGFTLKPHFVVRERDLAVLRPGEIVFGSVACAEDARRRVAAILHGPRPLSDELLAQLYIFRETDPRRADVLHVTTLVAHCVTDGTANSTFARCLLDTIARDGGPEPAQETLEDRLAMVVSPTDLEPTHLRSLSPAVRRWRQAVWIVILQLRMEKRRGGHTLPCRLTRSTPLVAAQSGVVSTSLTLTQTATVIANCHLHRVKFGNACLALAQVAMTRVLYRRYLRGEISEKEWAYRKRQPLMSGGPLNLRPYLDKAWFERGGGGEFMLSLSTFFYELPFMTLGETADQRTLSDGAPPFSNLLTFKRLLHRARLIEQQAAVFFNHPLFFEIVHAVALMRLDQARRGALQWMKHVQSADSPDIHRDDEVLEAMDVPMVHGFQGASIGNMDLMFPSEYPLPPTHPLSPYSSVPHPVKAGYVASPSPSPSAFEVDMTPKIVLENMWPHLRTHPGELYLSALRARGQLTMHVFYDRNVYEEGVVREWLDEVREAVLWYLGQTHQLRRAQRAQRGYGGVSAGHDEAVQAKL